MKMDLNVYVWFDFEDSVSYHRGLAVAVAYTFDDAVTMLEKRSGITYDETLWGEVQIYPLCELAFLRRGSN